MVELYLTQPKGFETPLRVDVEIHDRLAAPATQITLGSVLTALGEPLFDEPTFCDRLLAVERARSATVPAAASASTTDSSGPDTP